MITFIELIEIGFFWMGVLALLATIRTVLVLFVDYTALVSNYSLALRFKNYMLLAAQTNPPDNFG